MPSTFRGFSRKSAKFEASKQMSIPLIGKFVLDEFEENDGAYVNEIEGIKRCFPDKFRGVRLVKSVLAGSMGSLAHILFSYREQSVLALYGLYNLKPISMFSPVRSEIVVLDTLAWKHIPQIYSKGKTIIVKEQPYDLFERRASYSDLTSFVRVVASNQDCVDVSYAEAVSGLTLLSSYSIFFENILFYYQFAMSEPCEQLVLPNSYLEMARNWSSISKLVHDGNNQFLINGKLWNFEELSMTLMDSNVADRKFVPPEPQNESKLRYLISGKPLTKVSSLELGKGGYNLVVTVLSCQVLKAAADPDRRIREYLVGDDSGTILFTGRDHQVDVLKVGMTFRLLHARVHFYNGGGRLVVQSPGWIEVAA